ncbi:MAG: type II toxin-antitoxin system VapB family antitoxin [Candidatus Binatia bacterium]
MKPLLQTARRIGRHRIKRETINEARKGHIQRRSRLQALKAFGTIDFDPKHAYKKSRARR